MFLLQNMTNECLIYIPEYKLSKVYNYIWSMKKWVTNYLRKVEKYTRNMNTSKIIKKLVSRARRIATIIQDNHHKLNKLIYMVVCYVMMMKAQGDIIIYNKQLIFDTY